MLRALLSLLWCVTDREIITDLAHQVLVMGLVNVSVLGCIGASRLAVGWQTSASHLRRTTRLNNGQCP